MADTEKNDSEEEGQEIDHVEEREEKEMFHVLLDNSALPIILFILGAMHTRIEAVICLLLLALYNIYRTKTVFERKRKLMLERKASDPKFLKTVLGAIPNWVSNAEEERTRFLNNMIDQIWPHAKGPAEEGLRDYLDNMFKVYYLPYYPFLNKLEMYDCDLGQDPPMLLGVNVITLKDKVFIDLNIRKSGRTNISILTGFKGVDLKILVGNLQFEAKQRIVLDQLTSEAPYCRAVSISMAEKPTVSFKLEVAGKLVGINPDKIPGVSGIIEEAIDSAMCGMTWPSCNVVDMFGPEDKSFLSLNERAHLERREGTGLVRIRLLNSSNLTATECSSNVVIVVRIGIKDMQPASCDGLVQQEVSTVGKVENGQVVWDEDFDMVLYDKQMNLIVFELREKEERGKLLGTLKEKASNLVAGKVHGFNHAMDIPKIKQTKSATQLKIGFPKLSVQLQYIPYSRQEEPYQPLKMLERVHAEWYKQSSVNLSSLSLTAKKPMADPARLANLRLFVSVRCLRKYPYEKDLQRDGTVFRDCNDPVQIHVQYKSKVRPTKVAPVKQSTATKFKNKLGSVRSAPPVVQEDGVCITKKTWPLPPLEAGGDEIFFMENFNFRVQDALEDKLFINTECEKDAQFKGSLSVKDIMEHGSKGVTMQMPLTASEGRRQSSKPELEIRFVVRYADAESIDKTNEIATKAESSGTIEKSTDTDLVLQETHFAGGMAACFFVSYFTGWLFGVVSAIGLSILTFIIGGVIYLRSHNGTLRKLNETQSSFIARLVDYCERKKKRDLEKAAAEAALELQRKAAKKKMEQPTENEVSIVETPLSVADQETEAELVKVKQELPLWVHFPDVEKTDWLNEILEALWPHICKGTEAMINEKISGALGSAGLPDFLGSLQVNELTLGSTPPVISGVRSFSREAQGDQIIFDIALSFANDLAVEAGIRDPFTVRFSDLSFSTTLRVIMGPLVGMLPCIGSVSICLTDTPEIDFALDVCRIPLLNMPGVFSLFKHLVADNLGPMLVHPQIMDVTGPLVDMNELARRIVNKKWGDGILRVTVVSASKLKNTDALFFGKSDPFCEVTLHQQPAIKRRTRYINDNLNPVWNDDFEFIVNDTRAKIQFTVLDKDVRKSEIIGIAEMEPFHELEPDMTVEKRLPLLLKGKDHGSITVRLEWKPFNKDVNSEIARDPNGRAIAAAFVHISQCTNLDEEADDIKLRCGNFESSLIASTESDDTKLRGRRPLVQATLSAEVTSFDQDLVLDIKNNGTVHIPVRDIVKNDGKLSGAFPIVGTVSSLIELQASVMTVSKSKGTTVAKNCMSVDSGVLRLWVYSAHGLLNVETFSKSDPFCEIKLPREPTIKDVETKYISNNLNPVWDERYEFVISDADGVVEFVVRDHEVTGIKEKVLGRTQIQINDLVPNTRIKLKLNLRTDKGKMQGTLNVDVEYKPFRIPKKGDKPLPPAQSSLATEAAKDWLEHPWAKNVVYCMFDSWKEPPSSSASLRLLLNKDQMGATKVMKASDDMINSGVRVLGSYSGHIIVEATKSGKVLASGAFPADKLKLDPVEAQPMIISLNGKEETFAKVNTFVQLLTLGPTVDTLDQDASESLIKRKRSGSQNKNRPSRPAPPPKEEIAAGGAPATKTPSPVYPTIPDEDEDLEPGSLTVEVKHARNLKTLPNGNEPDAYVSLRLGGLKFKTKVQEKHTINPDWDKQNTFAFPVLNPLRAELDVRVKAQLSALGMGFLSKNQTIAKGVVVVNDHALNETPLPLTIDLDTGGTVSLELSYRKYNDKELSQVTAKQKLQRYPSDSSIGSRTLGRTPSRKAPNSPERP
eukprot:m.63833 g.63833  ORF g.63833 m.63833 type:complete len:1818 (-) comp11607_c0_seq1:19-5472(-)